MTTRQMTAADIEAVMALESAIPEAPHWKRDAYEACVVADPGVIVQRAGFVAESGGSLGGFAVGQIVAGNCELESIAVRETLRSGGVGQSLLHALTQWARARGAQRIELEVRASNERAIRFYERAGMRREGVRVRYYHDPEEDAVLMGADLDLVENFAKNQFASGPPGC